MSLNYNLKNKYVKKTEMDQIMFVTAYYNIRDREQNIFRNDGDNHFCNPNTYLKALQKLLSRPIQIIIFTEPSLEQQVRKRIMYPQKQLVVVKNYEELELWPLYPKIKEMDQLYHVPNNAVEKFTPLYYLIIHQKLFFTNQAITKNYFPQATHCAWIDIRGLELSQISDDQFNSLPKFLKPNKININMMMYTQSQEIQNLKEYYKFTRGKIAATFFSGPFHEMTVFFEKFKQELMQSPLAVTEEAVYGVVCKKYAHLFHFHYGDYQDSILNMDGVLHTERAKRLAHLSFMYALGDCDFEQLYYLGKQIIQRQMIYPDLSDREWMDILLKTYLVSFQLEKWQDCKKILQIIRGQPRLNEIVKENLQNLSVTVKSLWELSEQNPVNPVNAVDAVDEEEQKAWENFILNIISGK